MRQLGNGSSTMSRHVRGKRTLGMSVVKCMLRILSHTSIVSPLVEQTEIIFPKHESLLQQHIPHP